MMLAAKHLDPLLGIDVHIVQPPGPVPPIPVPHPYVGIVMDPFDYAPFIGATVSVNHLPRAQAGTSGQAIPPHIPIGGVFVKPPSNESEMFMGSATVAIDGDAMTYLALPVLSCQDVGMIAPPRAKKKSTMKSMVLPTTVVLPIPAGPPVLVGGPPTISLMALGMRVGMAALGRAFKKLRSLQRGSRRMKAVSDRVHRAATRAMDALGVPPSVQNRVHRGICSVTGHPVDVATGKVFTEAIDFVLGGPMTIRWQRVWFSSSHYRGPLGHGWHHNFDLALARHGSAVAVRLADGRCAWFADPAPGDVVFDRRERLRLWRDEDTYVLQTTAHSFHRFRKGPSGIHRLTQIHDRNGNALRFDYDAYDRLTAIHDGIQRRLSLHGDAEGRIVRIDGTHPTDLTRSVTLAHYAYSAAGDLVLSTDAMNYRIGYDYDDHLLVCETMKNGLCCHFEWDRTTPLPRCTHTWIDGGLHEYTLHYDDALQRTLARNSSGTTTYEWNDQGVVTRVIDPLGGVATTTWNEFSQPLETVDPNGNACAFAYDDFGRRTSTTDPMGNQTHAVYDDRDLLQQVIDQLGTSVTYHYDERGNTIGYTDELGRNWQVFRDARGRSIRTVDPLGHAVEQSFSPDHRTIEVHDVEGLVWRCTIDAWARVTTVEHRRKPTISYAYDLRNKLIAKHHADGTSCTFAYNAAGSLIEYTDRWGRASHYGYVGMERLATSSRPHVGTFRYDYEPTRERICRIVNENGEVATIEHDAIGRPIAFRMFDGRLRTFGYDAGGRRTRLEEDGGLHIEYEFNANNLLLAWKAGDDAEARYAYDARGLPILATSGSSVVAYTYDAARNLLREEQDGLAVVYEYDELNRRVILRNEATGRTLAYRYDHAGRLLSVGDHSGFGQAFAYASDRGLIERRLGAHAIERFAHGPSRRVAGQEVVNDKSQQLVRRHYERNRDGAVISIDDRYRGRTLIQRGLSDEYAQVSRDQHDERFSYDRAGNMTHWSELGDVEYDAGNRVRRAGPRTYAWDAAGRVQKIVEGSREIEFSYDGLGRLVRATTADHVAEYRYDATSRRTEKIVDGHSTRFMWDANVLLAELADDHTVEYAFVPNFAFPLMQWIDGTGYHCVLETNGSVTELVDAKGDLVWWGRYDSLGALSESRDSGVAQRLRLLGQYEDVESKLHYNMYRYYDPSVGRYTSPDPLGILADPNLYAYAPNIFDWSDPYGLSKRPSGSPSSTRRQQLKDGEFGDACEVCGRTTVGDDAVARPNAEHIVPDSEIRAMDGFDELPRAEQQAVRNTESNFTNLCENCNKSRQATPYSEWDGHPSHEPLPGAIDDLAEREARLAGEIQADIDARLERIKNSC